MQSMLSRFVAVFVFAFISGCGGCRHSPLGDDDPDGGELLVDAMLPSDSPDASDCPYDSGVTPVDGSSASDADAGALVDANTSGNLDGGAVADASDGGSGGSSDGGTGGSLDGGSGGSYDGGSGTSPDASVPECDSNDDCPAGEICEGGTCVCDGEDDDGSGSCGSDKALLCHYPPGNQSNPHNICVGTPAVPAHQAHGDTLGACP